MIHCKSNKNLSIFHETIISCTYCLWDLNMFAISKFKSNSTKNLRKQRLRKRNIISVRIVSSKMIWSRTTLESQQIHKVLKCLVSIWWKIKYLLSSPHSSVVEYRLFIETFLDVWDLSCIYIKHCLSLIVDDENATEYYFWKEQMDTYTSSNCSLSSF